MIEIGGSKRKFKLDFATSIEILQQVQSPTQIVQSITVANMFREKGLNYDSEFEWDENNVSQVLHIGLDGDQSFEEVGEWVMEMGIFHAMNEAVAYLLAMTGGKAIGGAPATGAPAKK
jgi:hypothetical protein